MERVFIGWQGHRICVSELQSGGRPLFLVPGIGCGAEMWQPFIQYFPNRRIISFDAPGAGHLLLWDEPERIAPQIGHFVGWG